jgi:starch-binding outer membrane protein, SusD/RagB family
MKRLKIKVLAVGMLALAVSSCKKELELFPNNQVELSQTFSTVREAQEWNTGLYGLLRGRFYGIYQYTQDIQGDQLNATVDFGNRNGFPHRWTGFLADDGTIASVWSGYYRGITNINLALPQFEKITPSAEATNTGRLERGNMARYKADAYFARAYFYHELIIRFAKPYEPATASSDPGVPIVLEYAPKSMPARASVKAVYDQILADVTGARTLYAQAKTEYDAVTTASSRPNITGAQGSTKFTTDGLTAFEARVKLHMQDWDGAKAAADAVIATGRYPLITAPINGPVDPLKDYWHKDEKQEDIMQLAVANTTEQANTNGSIYLGFRTSDSRYRPDFMPSQWVLDKYEATDRRKAVYFATLPLSFTVGTTSKTLVNKFPGNPTLFTTATTNYQHAPKFLRIAEMYLISAEAGAKGSDDADGLAKLNSLRTARGLTALTGLADDALFAEVKEERFRELAFEGFRLWDMKRWHEGFTRNTPQTPAVILSSGTGYTTLSIAADNPKFTWAIPSRDIQVNPNLVQNQGW